MPKTNLLLFKKTQEKQKVSERLCTVVRRKGEACEKDEHERVAVVSSSLRAPRQALCPVKTCAELPWL